MKNKIFRPVSVLLILVMGCTFVLTSCENEPEAMKLPPQESLIMDLSIFPGNNQKAMDPILSNWAYSSLNVFFWSATAFVHTAIPVAAYKEAFKHTPVYLEDNTWQWSYTVVVANETYLAELIGTRLNEDEFRMEMFLSKTTGADLFEDFKWFEGVARYDRTAATWKLSYDPFNQTEYLEAAYKKESDIETLRYTVIDPQNEIYESYIEYGQVPDDYYDAYFTLNLNDTITSIEWSTTTNEGRVMNEVDFDDPGWHCWNGQLQDVDCSTE